MNIISYIAALFLLFLASNLFSYDLDSIINKLQNQPNDSNNLEYIQNISDDLIKDNKPNEAITLLRVGLEFSLSSKEYVKAIEINNSIGTAFRNISKFDSALYYHNNALILLEKYGTIQQKIRTLNNVGVAHRRKGENNSAIYYHIEALKLAEELNDKHSIAIANNSIGNIYLAIKQPLKAIDYFNAALEIQEEMQNLLGLAINYNNIGEAYQELQDFDKALMCFYKSLEYNIEIEDEKGIAICYNSIGNVMRSKGDYKAALYYFQQALELDLVHQDDIYKSNSLINIGEIYYLLKDYRKAIEHLSEAMANSESIGSIQQLQTANEHLYKIYDDMGDHKKALEHYKKSVLFKDSLLNEQTAAKILEIQSDFELRQKAARIIMLESEKKAQTFFLYGTISGSLLLLILVFVLWKGYIMKKDANNYLIEKNKLAEQHNSELKEMNEKLNELNRTKDKFFSIIAHDLKNPFSSILNYTNSFIEDFEQLDNKSKLEKAVQINESSKQIFKLLENLLEWSRSQTGTLKFIPTEFDFYELAINSVFIVQKSAKAKNITIENFVAPDTIINADYNMLNTIMRNLLTNAVKFTNSNGKIKIIGNMTRADNKQYLTVEVIDNGVGISRTRLENLFNIERGSSTAGTSNETGTGLGLILCKEFIEKHKGTIEVESEEGKGSKFIFSIPIA